MRWGVLQYKPPPTQTHKYCREISPKIDRKTRIELNTTAPTKFYLRHNASSNFFPSCQPVDWFTIK